MSVIREIAAEESKLEMTPMIDVTFLLLIFFMCTIKFKTLEGKLAAYLPKDVGVNPSEAVERTEPILVRLDLVRAGTRLDPRDAAEKRSRDPRKVAPWRGSGRFVFGNDREVSLVVGPRGVAGLEDLESRLVTLFAADPERAVKIDVRSGVVYEDVVGVVDRVALAGFTDVTFVGSFDD